MTINLFFNNTKATKMRKLILFMVSVALIASQKNANAQGCVAIRSTGGEIFLAVDSMNIFVRTGASTGSFTLGS